MKPKEARKPPNGRGYYRAPELPSPPRAASGRSRYPPQRLWSDGLTGPMQRRGSSAAAITVTGLKRTCGSGIVRPRSKLWAAGFKCYTTQALDTGTEDQGNMDGHRVYRVILADGKLCRLSALLEYKSTMRS
jgi:hypothetical protein